MVCFSVLGPLEVRFTGRSYVPAGPMIRKIFALLLLERNRVVSFDALCDELWDGEPPVPRSPRCALTCTT